MDPLSLIASTLTIIQSISSTYNFIQHIKGLPNAFKEVGQELPLVKETLDLVRSQFQASCLDDSSQKAIEPIIRGCHEKIKALNEIMQEIEKKKKKKKNDKNANDWSALVSSYRTMMLRMGKAHRVEVLMQGILSGLKGLAVHHLFLGATKAQVDKLEDAIQRLSEVEPSLPDSDFESSGTTFTQAVGDGGKANMFNAVGGPMTNKFGNEFNAAGPMHFGTDFMNCLMKGQDW
jgi:hypothetical protein